MSDNIRLFERDNSVSIKYRYHENEHIEKHWHRFIEMEFLVSGSGIHKINGNSYPIRRGELHIMKLTDIHEFFFEEKCGLYLVQIPTSYLSEKINSIILNCSEDMIVYFDDAETEKAESLFKILAEETQSGDAYSSDIIKSTISALCLLLFRKLKTDKKAMPRKSDNRINDIIIFLQNNFRQPLTIGKIAEKFYMNSEYFSRYFKKRMGIGPKEYLAEVRIVYAKKLVCQSDMKVLDICMECGYNSITTFLRDFNKKYGRTPKQMREQRKDQALLAES
jgi:AraC-like DNA-binding protein